MLSFSAEYFDGETSHSVPVQVSVTPSGKVRVTNEQGQIVREVGFEEVRVSPRIGNTRRALRFADGSALESADNAGIDAMLAQHGTGFLTRVEHVVHLLERNGRIALLSVVGLVALGIVGFVWGVPLLAKQVAMKIPASVASQLGQGTLDALDELLFEPSQLPTERRAELTAAFAEMARGYPELPLTLVYRSAMPNAFALPNGTVVVTDELVELSENDREVMAVLAHEIGHVHERHALRMALENSMVALFAMAYLGDASQMSIIAGSLPTIYANAHFSRSHETEADTFALQFLTHARIPRHHFADILRRLHAELGRGESSKQQNSLLDYFASHPGIEERAARFVDP
jgi:Zn-dependent protease with chaperone function